MKDFIQDRLKKIDQLIDESKRTAEREYNGTSYYRDPKFAFRNIYDNCEKMRECLVELVSGGGCSDLYDESYEKYDYFASACHFSNHDETIEGVNGMSVSEIKHIAANIIMAFNIIRKTQQIEESLQNSVGIGYSVGYKPTKKFERTNRAVHWKLKEARKVLLAILNLYCDFLGYKFEEKAETPTLIDDIEIRRFGNPPHKQCGSGY